MGASEPEEDEPWVPTEAELRNVRRSQSCVALRLHQCAPSTGTGPAPVLPAALALLTWELKVSHLLSQ